MVVKYSWLKIMDILKKHGSRVSLRDLRQDLDSRGFYMEAKELGDDLAKMRDLGLIEADVLVAVDGTSTTSLDDYSTIGITTAGIRKLAAIVKI